MALKWVSAEINKGSYKCLFGDEMTGKQEWGDAEV